MSGTRWLVVASGLVVVFLVSVAAGALIVRQLNARPVTPPIAVVSPTPAPLSTATPGVASASPGSTPDPTSAPTAVPTHTPTPAIPTPATPTPVPTVALDPPTVEDFTNDLATALAERDRAYLRTRLHPAVIERYGEQACRRYLRDVGGQANWEILSSEGPATWDYVSDEVTTTIPDAWTVSVRQPGADPELRELHFAPADGTWRWFSDCGDPV